MSARCPDCVVVEVQPYLHPLCPCGISPIGEACAYCEASRSVGVKRRAVAPSKAEVLAEFDAELVGDDPVRKRLLGEMKGTSQPPVKAAVPKKKRSRRSSAEVAEWRAVREARREQAAILADPTWIRDEEPLMTEILESKEIA